MDDLLNQFIKGFFGYGNLKAPYWFIGMEEACGPEPILHRLEAWRALRHREVLDLAEFHEAIAATNLFGEAPTKIQPTWRGLIRAVYAANGLSEPSATEVARYQGLRLGRSNDETCLLELFPLPSPRLKDWTYARLS